MGIVHGVNQVLQSDFKVVLSCEVPRCDVALELFKATHEVEGGLLVSRRWAF